MSALDDKDIPSDEEWRGAVSFMTESLQRQTKVAEERVEEMVGPTSTYDRWVRWKSQSEIQVWRGDGEGWRVGGGERWRV